MTSDVPRHNHLTRDIKRPFICPACDKYHSDEQLKIFPDPPPGFDTHESFAKFVESYR